MKYFSKWQNYINNPSQVLNEAKKEEPKESGETDWLGMILDAAGIIPGFGEAFDAIAAARHIMRGEYFYALLSIISILPVAGDIAAKSIKYGTKTGKTLGKSASVKEVAEFLGSENFKKFSKLIKSNKGKIKSAVKNISSTKKVDVNELKEFLDFIKQF